MNSLCPSFVEKGIRCADAIIEWGPLSQVPKPAELFARRGVSPSADGDLGLCPKNLQTFEKSLIKTFILSRRRFINSLTKGIESFGIP